LDRGEEYVSPEERASALFEILPKTEVAASMEVLVEPRPPRATEAELATEREFRELRLLPPPAGITPTTEVEVEAIPETYPPAPEWGVEPSPEEVLRSISKPRTPEPSWFEKRMMEAKAIQSAADIYAAKEGIEKAFGTLLKPLTEIPSLFEIQDVISSFGESAYGVAEGMKDAAKAAAASMTSGVTGVLSSREFKRGMASSMIDSALNKAFPSEHEMPKWDESVAASIDDTITSENATPKQFREMSKATQYVDEAISKFAKSGEVMGTMMELMFGPGSFDTDPFIKQIKKYMYDKYAERLETLIKASWSAGNMGKRYLATKKLTDLTREMKSDLKDKIIASKIDQETGVFDFKPPVRVAPAPTPAWGPEHEVESWVPSKKN
jgi:hypothetical protein